MKLTLPYPVSSNRYWRAYAGRHGSAIVVPSPEAEVYRESVGWIAKKEGIRSPVPGLLELHIVLHPLKPRTIRVSSADVRCMDLDNCLKVAIDALQGIAYENDKQIRKIVAERGEPVEQGALVVEIRPYELKEAA